jgi:protein-arginine kinase activator protein McsA
MDSQGSVLDECCSDLEELVAREAYVQAAEIKSEITQLVMDDAVTVLLQQLQRALQSEDYTAVAQLRTEGWAWLEGWWASEGGQLLRVAPE